MNKLLVIFCVFALLFSMVIAVTACGGSGNGEEDRVWPDPITDAPLYTENYALPQTQSAEQLSEYLANEHFECDLDGWFFFGSLVDDATPDDIGTFFISMQRIEASVDGSRLAYVPAIVAFDNASLGQYVYGGANTMDVSPLINVLPDPWKVEVNSLDQEEPLMTMSLVSGSMGMADAVYSLTADVPDQLGGRLQVDMQLRDGFGVVNQGYGTASFFPQYLTEPQREEIEGSYGDSVKGYLESTGDPMSGQGSFYYSLPLMDVEQFTITRDGATLSSGTGGTMWMDNVVQTYGQQASEILADASWQFFSIMLPDENAALMVIQIESETGTLPVATLFAEDCDRTRNSAREAVHSWAIDEIDIEEVPGTAWTSPETGLEYAQQHRIRLNSEDRSADLTISMVRENQEIVIGEKIKYEGLGWVEGTLDGQPVTGTVFMELQPVGYL